MHYGQEKRLSPAQNDSTAWMAEGLRRCSSGTPMGATPTPEGISFVVFSAHATAVELCLLIAGEERRYPMFGPDRGRWSLFVPGAQVGTVYGYRFHGPWDPDSGHLFNPQKLILDPYARALRNLPTAGPEIYAHEVDASEDPTAFPLQISPLNSADSAPWGVVIENDFEISPHPQHPLDETVIYEAHVVGLTKNLPGVPPELRGTYAGLASPACVSYLQDLGITTLELLPVHAKFPETFLRLRDRENYWGYSTLNYFYPEPTYATEAAQSQGPKAVIDEFRGMVSILHQAGIEVILDVVYNHTCEGANTGPSLSWRGADNSTYYMQDLNRPGHLVDVTGTGNSMNFTSPAVIQMALDSLRYWVSQMGIDGFRFDLGVTSARLRGAFDPFHPFLMAMQSDPILRTRKLIMEPWDIGFDGWHTGDFPAVFSTWNDHFRSDVRDFWLPSLASLEADGSPNCGQSALASRLAGSADVYYRDPAGVVRSPLASVNFVTAHDGFTLADLVSYNHKHNEANGEDNRDGTDDNRSWNHGFEGGFKDLVRSDLEAVAKRKIFAARLRSMKNLFATLMLSAGVPMLVAGDEFARTQLGNNNAYCQDSPISWLDWQREEWQLKLFQMNRLLLKIRRDNRALRPRRFATGQPLLPSVKHPDLAWYNREGNLMEGADWSDISGRCLQMHRCSGRVEDADVLVVINGTLESQQVSCAIPASECYQLVWDSAWESPCEGGWDEQLHQQLNPVQARAGSKLSVGESSIQVYLQQVRYTDTHD